MFTCTMVGANFRPRETKDVIRSLTIGEEITLRPEPENPHDGNAVACDYDDVHLGYVPRDSNGGLSLHLNSGGLAKATIVAWESDIKPVLEIEMFHDTDYGSGQDDAGHLG